MLINPAMAVRKTMLHIKTGRLNRYLDGASAATSKQRANLLQRVERNASSQFGRDHDFAGIRSVEDFRKRVPVSDYEKHRPYIDQVIQGDVEALFHRDTRVLMFATTSGTTDQPKMLPVTEEFYRQYKASWQYWGTGVYRDYPHLLNMKTLQFSSRWNVTHTPAGVPCGNISGLAAETRPFYIGTLFVLPTSVMQVSGHVAKHYTSLRLSLASRRVGMIVTANPSTLVEVAKLADLRKDELIRDIFNGTLSEEIEVPATVRQTLKSKLKRNPRRARELQQIVEKTGRLLPKDAWPDLTILAVWRGGSVEIYLSQLPEYYGNVAIRDHGISASEGRMTIPLANSTPEGMLDYATHFYEFIPEHEHGTKDPTVLEAHELEPGQNYFILLTTSAGLYRYDIYDLVRCHGYEGQTPILSFLNKGKNFASFTGEKLSEHQVVQAMTATLGTLGLESCTFTLAPKVNERPQYHLIVDDGPQAKLGDKLAAEMQRQLEKVNVEYADKCLSGRIEPITLRTVPLGTWEKLRGAKSVERGNFEEYKHPCLTGDLEFMDRLDAIHADDSDRSGTPA